MSIKLNEYNFENPLYNSYKWYDIKFEDTGKEVMINHLNATTTSLPAIFKNFTKKFEFDFNGEPIKNQDDIIEKYNFKVELEKDIQEKKKIDARYAKFLNNNEISRNRLEPVKYATIQKDDNITKRNIIQDSILVGSITKEYKRNLGSTEIKEIQYWIMERFEQYQGGTEKLPEYYAAGARIENSIIVNNIKLYTFADGKNHTIKVKDHMNAEKEIINFLLDKGYL